MKAYLYLFMLLALAVVSHGGAYTVCSAGCDFGNITAALENVTGTIDTLVIEEAGSHVVEAPGIFQVNTTGVALLINASGAMLDCQGAALTGNASGKGIEIRKANVVVKDCDISLFSIGIFADNADSASLQGNIVDNVNYGIRFDSSNDGTITDSIITGAASSAILWNSAANNTLYNSNLLSSNIDIQSSGTGTYNYAVNSSFTSSKLMFSENAILDVQYYVRASVDNTLGQVQLGSQVNVSDRLSNLVWSDTTDALGLTQIRSMTTQRINATGTLDLNNFTFTALKDTLVAMRTVNITASSTVSLTIDISDPVITSIAIGHNNSVARINWSTDEPATTVVKYGTASGIYPFSVQNLTLAQSHSASLLGLTGTTVYYFVVNSTDASGNSAQSSQQSFTTDPDPDVTPPVITIASPANASTVSDWTSISLSVTTDEAAICIADSYLLGSAVVTTDAALTTVSGLSHTRLFNASSDSSGYNFYFIIKCTDTSGNFDSKVTNFKVNDSTVPTITFSTSTIADDEKTNDQTPTFTISTNEPMAAGYPKISIDGGSQATMAASLDSFVYTTPALAAGNHNATIYALDRKGNSASYLRHFSIDITKPDIEINAPVDATTYRSCKAIEFNVTLDEEGTCSYELLWLDQEGYDDCTETCDDKYDRCYAKASTTTEKNTCKDAKDDCYDDCEDDKYDSKKDAEMELVYGYDECSESCQDLFDICEDSCGDVKKACLANAVDSDDRRDCSEEEDDCVLDCSDESDDCDDECLDSGVTFFEKALKCYEDGEYIALYTCSDIAGNTEISNATFTLADNLAPTIIVSGPNGTISEISTTIFATTDEDASCRYSLEDVSYASMQSHFTQSGVTHTALVTGLINGDHVYYVRCNDSNGNVMTSSKAISFTIDTDAIAIPEHPVAPEQPSASKVFETVVAGQPYTFSLADDAYALREVVLVTNENLNNIELIVEKLDTQNLVEKPQDSVYQYFTVTKKGLSNKQIASIKLKYRIGKSWISSGGLDPSLVSLVKYTDSWNALATKKTGEDSGYYMYEAEVQDLSMFAITAKPAVAIPSDVHSEPETEPIAEEPGEVKEQGNLWWILILCALVVGGGTAVFVLKTRHPQQDPAGQAQLAPAAASNLAAATSNKGIPPSVTLSVTPKKDADHKDEKEVDNMADPIKDYISKTISAGYSLDQVREALQRSGYEDDLITAKFGEMKLQPVDQGPSGIEQYIESCLASGYSAEAIKAALVNAGHEPVQIQSILDNAVLTDKDELIEYVRQCRKEKMGWWHIKSLLKKSGYTKDDIKRAMKEVK